MVIYLASPYSHPSQEVKNMRFRAACVATGNLIRKGHVVISPIAHTHPVKVLSGLGGEWETWRDYDIEIIRCCSALWVLAIDEWQESVGVEAEISIAKDMDKPITVVPPSKVGLLSEYPYVKTLAEMGNPI